MFNSNIKFKGRVQVHLGDVLIHDIDNLVVDTGKAMGVSRVFSNTEFAPMAYIGIGTDGTNPVGGNVALGNQLVRQAFDSAPARVNNAVTVKTTYAAGVGTGTIREAGLFNASAGGQMFSRVKFGDVPKSTTDPISITWIISAP